MYKRQVKENIEVRVTGTIREFKGNRELTAIKVEDLSNVPSDVSTIDDILDFIRKSGAARKDIVMALCKRKGIDFSELSRYNLREDKEFVWIERDRGAR